MPHGGFVNGSAGVAEQSRIVRLPLNRVGSLNKISKTFLSWIKFERTSPEELAEVLDVTTGGSGHHENLGRHVSMDALLSRGKTVCWTFGK